MYNTKNQPFTNDYKIGQMRVRYVLLQYCSYQSLMRMHYQFAVAFRDQTDKDEHEHAGADAQM